VYDGLDMRARLAGIGKLVDKYAMMYPIGKPAGLLIRAWMASHTGDATSQYRRAIAAAEKLQMPGIATAAQRGLARS
jgi:hypothetical protein